MYNKLLEYNGKFFLFSTNKSLQNGVNPIIFEKYVDYIKFTNRQFNKNKYSDKKNFVLLRSTKTNKNPEKFKSITQLKKIKKSTTNKSNNIETYVDEEFDSF